MPGPLAALEDLNRDQITEWLRRTLAGQVRVPGSDRDDSPATAILAGEPELAGHTRRDIAHGTLVLIGELNHDPAPAPEFSEELLTFAVGLKLTEAVPVLLQIADQCAKKESKLAPPIHSAIAFAILNLRVRQEPDFWQRLWKADPMVFASPAFAALLDHDPFHAIEFLPGLPNDQQIADSAALNVEYQADLLPGARREQFRESVEQMLKHCERLLQTELRDWLEREKSQPTIPPESQALFEALGGPGPSLSARLCGGLNLAQA